MTASMTMTVSMTLIIIAMPMAFIPAVMAAVIMPVITVSFVTAVADNYLVAATAISCLSYAVISIIAPWIRTIDHYFIAMINVIATPPIRQISSMYPYTVV